MFGPAVLPWVKRALAATLLVFAAGSAHAQPAPTTGPVAVQEVELVPGTNLVSLRVAPDDPSLGSILDGIGDDVVLVKDAQGTIFAPSFLVTDLMTWAWGESVLVQVTTPVTLSVRGATIDPTSPIELKAGWNWIPFLLEEPTSVEAALGSLGSALELVEDGLGRSYPAAPGGALLETMAPGRGYKVRLSEPRTFSYASAPDGPSQSVATIEQALALTGLEPGQRVRVRGFRAEGDGGAGELQVTTSGCVPDGGTCFVPTEHTEAGAPVSAKDDVTLYGSSIQWESLRLCHSSTGTPADPTTASGDGCYDALQLHGHGGEKGGQRLFEASNGQIAIRSGMRNYAKLYDGDGDAQHAITYRYSTSPLRLERVVEPLQLEGSMTTAYTRPEWWGGSPEVGDATDAVSWALEVAEAKGAAAGTEYYAVLEGMYHYAGVIETQEGTVLKGARDGVRDGQGLRVLAGAPWHYWAIRSGTDPAFSEPRTERDGLSTDKVVVRHGRTSMRDRVVDVEIDGNLAENDFILSAEYRTASGPSTYEGGSMVDELLQNVPHWNGFSAYLDSIDPPIGSNTILDNVHLHDFGGNILLSNSSCHFGGSRNIRVGNSVRNHPLYGIPTAAGTVIDGIEIYGFFWRGGIETYQGHYKNVRFVDTVPNPYMSDRTIMGYVNHRNDAPDPNDFYTPRADKHYYGEDVLVEGLTFDLRNSPDAVLPLRSLITYARGPQTVSDVSVLLGNPGEASRTVNFVGSMHLDATPTSSLLVDGVTFEGGGVARINSSYASSSIVRGLALPNGSGGGTWPGVYQVRTQSPDAVFVFETEGRQQARRPLEIYMQVPGAGADVFVKGSEFFNVDFPLYVTDYSAEAAARYRVFWQDVSLDVWRYGSASGYKDMQYFDNVTVTSTGRTSEAAGSLAGAALTTTGGVAYVDVPVDLFWEPLDSDYVAITGTHAARFQGWSNVGTEDGPILRLVFSGTTPVTVDWTAAVRPFPSGVVVPD